ncbi:MAG: ATP-binding cassette domain-containing protein, partial [Acidobacteriaceae bacterium]
RLSDSQRTSLRRSQIGFVFQRFNLLPTISAQVNIELAHEIAATGKPFDHQFLDHLSGLLQIQGRLDHRPNELSGGEQQRIAIARALITRPAILLADEPTGNLDTHNSETVLSMLHASSRELNQTVLMITHNPEAAQIADRVLHMRDGEILKIEEGSRRITRIP